MDFKGLITAVFCFLAVILSSSVNERIKKPESLTISEGFINPIGFYNSKPTFSWKLPVLEGVNYQSVTYNFQIKLYSKC